MGWRFSQATACSPTRSASWLVPIRRPVCRAIRSPRPNCGSTPWSLLAEAAGAAGMVGGQAVDLLAAGQVRDRHVPLDEAALEDMHARKTGALIRAACRLGAIVCGADHATVAAVDAYARDLGLAFQIVDDVLDVEGSVASLGKTAGKDAAAGKPTYTARYGVAGARARAAECVDRAQATLRAAGLEGRLDDIARWSLARQS